MEKTTMRIAVYSCYQGTAKQQDKITYAYQEHMARTGRCKNAVLEYTGKTGEEYRKKLWDKIRAEEQKAQTIAEKVRVRVSDTTVVLTSDEKYIRQAHEYAKKQQEDKVLKKMVFSVFNKPLAKHNENKTWLQKWPKVNILQTT
jgi:hypothetical protein